MHVYHPGRGCRCCNSPFVSISLDSSAARQIIHHFTTSRDTRAREKDVIKAIKDNELFQSIPGKVKVMGVKG